MSDVTREGAIDVETKVLVALRFFATGSYQLDIGSSIYFGMSQPSVSRVLHEVIDAANQPEIMSKWIVFPNSLDELSHLRQRFFEAHRFPGIFGCIDGTYVSIFPPHAQDDEYPEHIYVCRKGYHAINGQLICDWKMKILNVNARFLGSTNDAYILQNRNVNTYLKQLHDSGHAGFALFGDSGYPLRTYLLTPVADAQENTPEEFYNKRHMTARSIIERCNGLLKIRFRCLSKHCVLHYSPEVASKIINTCVVLHNIAIENNVPDPPENESDDEEATENDGNENDFQEIDSLIQLRANTSRTNNKLLQGRAHRDCIIQTYFNANS